MPQIHSFLRDHREQILRTTGQTAELIAVSGYAQPEDIRQSINAGFDAHIAKPPDIDQVMTLLAAED